MLIFQAYISQEYAWVFYDIKTKIHSHEYIPVQFDQICRKAGLKFSQGLTHSISPKEV